MRRPKGRRRYRGFGISMTPELYGRLLVLAGEREGQLPGGVSAVVRSIVEPYLDRLERRRRVAAQQSEAA